MKMLITPTLLNSWDFFLSAPEEWEEKAREEFRAMLRREPFLPTPAIQAGIDFERDVRDVSEGRALNREHDRYSECVEEIAYIVRGGAWQVKVQKTILSGGNLILLYGKVDVLKGPVCYDIKFTGKYEAPKYQKSAQHPIYLECLETVPTFKYLISDGSNVYVEEYQKCDIEPINPTIEDFFSWLRANPEYGELYFKNWEARY